MGLYSEPVPRASTESLSKHDLSSKYHVESTGICPNAKAEKLYSKSDEATKSNMTETSQPSNKANAFNAPKTSEDGSSLIKELESDSKSTSRMSEEMSRDDEESSGYYLEIKNLSSNVKSLENYSKPVEGTKLPVTEINELCPISNALNIYKRSDDESSINRKTENFSELQPKNSEGLLRMEGGLQSKNDIVHAMPSILERNLEVTVGKDAISDTLIMEEFDTEHELKALDKLQTPSESYYMISKSPNSIPELQDNSKWFISDGK
ncbi:unnamed protein product [Protopolystoma xenopodis]|uniref:Uncharacterized protein n=1 Tax=Protopolystoma xenopodis TaxID=117903 RepID=A0A3S5APW0_9PLAT|nr:unnamed protein product [Protopolystoma xenopodis]